MATDTAWLFKLAAKLAADTWPYSPRATARTPATKGVAMDVPEMVLVAVVEPIQADLTFTPRAWMLHKGHSISRVCMQESDRSKGTYSTIEP